jgi:hypothetical protein
MTGKRYYVTTFGDWKRRAASFANSHWFLLEGTVGESSAGTPERAEGSNEMDRCTPGTGEIAASTPILVLVEADEGTHGALEDDSSFDPLPHPLSQKPISHAAQSALAPHGVAPGTSTFDATETMARVHPLLRHRVF